jgi:hypothetical protein
MSGFVLNAFKVFIEDEESATASADPVSPILSLVNGEYVRNPSMMDWGVAVATV